MKADDFEETIAHLRSKLFRFAHRLLGDVEEARDVVQEVMIKAWHSSGGKEPVRNWEAWCMRMTRNLSVDHLRTLGRRRTYGLENSLSLAHGGPGPDRQTELNELSAKIGEIIRALPEKQRLIIHLRDVEGYTYQEIGDILAIDAGQVKINLFRARQRVREQIIKMNAYER